jgi:hypothetical protein
VIDPLDAIMPSDDEDGHCIFPLSSSSSIAIRSAG